ncbi:restriction endonuclease subunit S [Hugonella massiliensis]|uniref:restriction endonuclease subunit S n=1 Tax=Hugonella massiliensis TaxID=1720315 RepID=UPI000B2ACEE5|nr:restriction endonuclease subunit S [Hugonella massiliensis]
MTNKPPFDGERVRLGELIGKAKVNRCGDRQFPVLSMTMHDGIVRQRDRFKKAIASKDTSTYKIVYPQQLVVGFPIDEGVIYVQNFAEPGIMSPAYNIWDIDTSKVLPAYLELALHSPQAMTYYAAQMKGTTARRRTLSSDKLCDIRVPLPSLGRQLQTVRLFQQVRSLSHVNERNMAKLDLLVKSRFVEMFGDLDSDDSRPLKDVCSIITDGTHQSPKFVDEGIPFLFVSNIASDVVDYETNKFISAEDYEQLIRRTPIEIGDVLVSAVGSFGHPAVVRDGRPFCFQRHIAYLKPRHNLVDSDYLHAALLSDDAQRYMDRCAKGVAQRTVTLKSFKEMKIPVPSMCLQEEFAAFVSQVDKLRFEAQKQKDELQTLYDSLAQEYFAI